MISPIPLPHTAGSSPASLRSALSLAPSFPALSRLDRCRGDRERAQVGTITGRNASLSQRENTGYRCFPCQVTSINLMVALDSTAGGFMKSCKQAFGIDTEAGDSAHKREWAKLNTVWKRAKIPCDTNVKRARGEFVSFLTADWTSLLRAFEQQRGKIQDNELPASTKPSRNAHTTARSKQRLQHSW